MPDEPNQNATETSSAPTGTPPAAPPAQAQPAPAAEQGAQPAAPPSEKMLTQSQVNALIAEEKRKAYEKGRNEGKAQQPTTPAPGKSEPANAPDAMAEIQRLRADVEFANLINEKGLKLSRRQREVLRGHYDSSNPESVIELASEIFPSIAAPAAPAAAPVAPATAPVTPAQSPQGTPANPGYRDPGAAGNPDAGVTADPRTWTKDEIARYHADGTYLQKIETWKRSLSGSSGGLFPGRSTTPR